MGAMNETSDHLYWLQSENLPKLPENELKKPHPLYLQVRGKKHYKTKWCCAMPYNKEEVRIDKVCVEPDGYDCSACDLVNATHFHINFIDNKFIKLEKKRKLLAKGAKYFSLPEDDKIPLVIEDVDVDLAKTFCPSCNGSGKQVTRVDAFMWSPESELPNCHLCKGKKTLEVPINTKKCSNCGRIQADYNTHCWECKHDFKLNLSKFALNANQETKEVKQ